MSALTSFYLAQSPCGSIDIILILAHGEVLGACSTFAADRAGIAVPPGLVHLEMTFFPLQFAFNFWSSFMKEDFPFRPSGNRGSGSFVSYPQSSMLCSGNPGVLGVQRTPGEVAEARQPMYPSLPPEEQRPESESVPEVEN